MASGVLRKVGWTSEEDSLLRKCIEKYGKGKWHQVPLRAGLNRCRKSCRLRWLNYLEPNIKRGSFSLDEVDLMIRVHKLLGNRWSLIAGRLPGRTANDVKNYWNTHQIKKCKSKEQPDFIPLKQTQPQCTPKTQVCKRTKATCTPQSQVCKPTKATCTPPSHVWKPTKATFTPKTQVRKPTKATCTPPSHVWKPTKATFTPKTQVWKPRPRIFIRPNMIASSFYSKAESTPIVVTPKNNEVKSIKRIPLIENISNGAFSSSQAIENNDMELFKHLFQNDGKQARGSWPIGEDEEAMNRFWSEEVPTFFQETNNGSDFDSNNEDKEKILIWDNDVNNGSAIDMEIWDTLGWLDLWN